MVRVVVLPEPCLVALVGPSGAGKSTFAARHFRPTEVVSSDRCRALVSDDEGDQSASGEAFAVLHAIVRGRLTLGRLVVVDATNVQPEARARLIRLADEADLPAIAVVLDVPDPICVERNFRRPDRRVEPYVVRGQADWLRSTLSDLRHEGFERVHVLALDEIESATFEFVPLPTDLRSESGPFDIIGDVHGCLDELRELLDRLGYTEGPGRVPEPPPGRKAIFLGDLVDRGPDSVGVLDLVRRMVEAGTALCVPGNHDNKLLRKLKGHDVKIAHGLERTLAQIDDLPPDDRRRFVDQAIAFLESLPSHFVLDDGRLVVAHAGMKAEYQGRWSPRVLDFALYGETTGEVDQFGLPIRYRWAVDYQGRALVVYGHTPVPEPEWLNRTVNIDTGCVFGGRLSSLRYPEDEIVSVAARAVHSDSVRPFLKADRRPDGEPHHPLAPARPAPDRETREAGSVRRLHKFAEGLIEPES